MATRDIVYINILRSFPPRVAQKGIRQKDVATAIGKNTKIGFCNIHHRNLLPLSEKKMKSTNTMSSSSLKTFDYVLVQWLENIVLQHFHQFGVLFSFVNETKNVCSYGYMNILNRNTDVKS